MEKRFENIIRKVDVKPSNIDANSESLLILDEKTGELNFEEDVFMFAKSLFGRKYSYYIVNFNEFCKIHDLNCEISDPQKGITIKLKVSFELSCIRERVIKAARFFKANDNIYNLLERSFANWIRYFVDEHPNFTDDFLKLDEKIRFFIEDQAEEKGLRIRITKLEPVSNDITNFPPQHLTLIHKTKCEIQDDYIEVKSKIVLNLVNKRAFSWKNIEDPESWIKDKTNTIIQNELISKSFRQIIDDFEVGIKQRISTKLEEAVREIGYSIKHIISVPSEEIEEFLNGFSFGLSNSNIYVTQEEEIKVRLSITVQGKGTTLKGIDHKFIKPRTSIVDEVVRMTTQTTANVLRNTDPESYYMSFYENVVPLLHKEITAKLDKNFKIDTNDLIIDIRPLGTDLKFRFDKLCSERGAMTIESQSEATYYEIKYGVERVNNWYIFHKNHMKYNEKTLEEYADISEYLKNEIELDIKRLADSEIHAMNSHTLDAGIVNLFKRAQYIITDEFGLALKEPRLKRISAPDDSSNSIRATGYLARKEKIKKQLIAAIQADDDELVEELSAELDTVTKKLNNVKKNSSNLLDIDAKNDVKKISGSQGG